MAEKSGLIFWMGRVLDECNRASPGLAADPVHDLRVALRRCRSIADGLRSFDPYDGWVEMRKEGARLFHKLGELRDAQVMIEWVKSPGAPRDGTSLILLQHLVDREIKLKEIAANSLDAFNRKKWSGWIARLSKRTDRVPIESAAFRHLALERWQDAFSLHWQALRNRSHIGFHRLRIGLKKLRYTVENFLPTLHAEWGQDLRDLQDLLGEMHDLRVLLRTAIDIGAIQDKDSRDQWRSWTQGESRQRLDRYRQKMTGRDSLWRIWRAGLPQGEDLKSAAMARLETWASFRDPNSKRSRRVAQIALQLHDGLALQNLPGPILSGRSSTVLHLACLLHAVGASRRGKRPHRRSYRMIHKLHPPIGLAQEDLTIAGLVVRYHRGALPAPGKKELKGLTEEERQLVMILAGILRLAITFTLPRQTEIPRFESPRAGQALVVLAGDFDMHSALARKLARDRYLLELACGLPVMIRRQ